MATLVFLLSGSAFAATSRSAPTEGAAADLASRGDRPIQIPYPAMNNLKAFDQLAMEIKDISRGQPIGLIGFSAGGTLALRLSEFPALHVKDVLDFYGPPDLADWFSEHEGDPIYRLVQHNVGSNPRVINELSGPGSTTAHLVCAFGTQDTITYAGPSTASFDRDFHEGTVYYYDGPHAVTIDACYAAFENFVSYL